MGLPQFDPPAPGLAVPPPELVQPVHEHHRRFPAPHVRRPAPHQRREEPPQQEARDQDALRRRPRVLHLLDAPVHYQHDSPLRPRRRLRQPGVHRHQLLPAAGVLLQLLQSHNLLLHELRLQEVVREPVPALQEGQEVRAGGQRDQHGFQVDQQVLRECIGLAECVIVLIALCSDVVFQ